MPPVGHRHRQSSSTLRLFIALGLCCACALTLTPAQSRAAGQDPAAALRGSILALDSARQTALREVVGLSAESTDAADYRDFIIYLNTRIVAYCLDLAQQAGPAALDGLPCPSGPTGAGLAASPSASGEQIFHTTGADPVDARTQAEKTKALEGDLLAALGDFDEMLLKEEGKVAARVPSQREGGGAGQSGASGSRSASGGTGEKGAESSAEAGEGTTAGADDESGHGAAAGTGDRSGAVSGTPGRTGSGAGDMAGSAYGVPGGTLPPPKDDDIVARQLREAAEKETDPELKKKLWEEYWKYKGKKKPGE